jgi:hypothetical protein
VRFVVPPLGFSAADACKVTSPIHMGIMHSRYEGSFSSPACDGACQEPAATLDGLDPAALTASSIKGCSNGDESEDKGPRLRGLGRERFEVSSFRVYRRHPPHVIGAVRGSRLRSIIVTLD